MMSIMTRVGLRAPEKRDIPSDGQRQPQEEDKLEGVVKGKPVNDAQQALEDAAITVS